MQPINTGYLNIRRYIGCLNIYRTHVTANYSTYNNMFFFASDLSRVFTNGPGSIPGRVIPKTLKMVLDATLLNTQHYTVRIKGKVEQSSERSSALPYILV